MRLIDADALQEKIRDLKNNFKNAPTKRWMLNIVLSMLGDSNIHTPSIDPVHAAGGCYCRECEYLREWNAYRGEFCCMHPKNVGGAFAYFDPEDGAFCSFGKRKEGEDRETNICPAAGCGALLRPCGGS